MSDSNRESGYSFDLTMIVGATLAMIFLSAVMWQLGVNHEYYRQTGHQQAASRTSDADENAKLACFNSVATLDKLNCLENQIAAEREAKNSEYDLAAQQEMAEWAMWLVGISVVQGILSLGGVYLLVRNLTLAREATNAAIESNKVTREVGQAQARAYLSVVDINLNFNQDSILARVNIKNSGQSPARNVVIKGKIFAAYDEDTGNGRKIAAAQNSVFGVGNQSVVAAVSDQNIMISLE